MTPRLEHAGTHLLAMSSRWFAAPSTNVPMSALVRMFLDPIAAFEHMLEPQTEVETDVTQVSAPAHVNVATVHPQPFARTSTAATASAVSAPRQFSKPAIIKHTRPLSDAPKITTPPAPQRDIGNLMPFQQVRTAKAELRPVKSQTTIVTAVPGEFSDLSKTENEAPSQHQENLTSPRLVHSVTRMIRGAPALTSLLGENIGKSSSINPPLTRPAAAIQNWNTAAILPPPIEVEVESPSKAVIRATKSQHPEATHNAAAPREIMRQTQTIIFPTTTQTDGPTTSPEPATARAAQAPVTTRVNYEELLDELERRLAVEFLRHYGTSGV